MADQTQDKKDSKSASSSTEKLNNGLLNFQSSVKLKYVKLGYHYLISNALYLVFIPLLASAPFSAVVTKQNFGHLWDVLLLNFATVVICSVLLVFLATVYFMSRPKKVYLVDFACYKPDPARKATKSVCMDRIATYGTFTQGNVEFQRKIFERSGLGDETYVPESVMHIPPKATVDESRKEVEMLMFGAVDELLAKTRLSTKDIGMLITNCSLFNPSPSLSAMIVNRYKLRGNIISYNLGGMGCSAGLISIALAKDLLQVCVHTL